MIIINARMEVTILFELFRLFRQNDMVKNFARLADSRQELLKDILLPVLLVDVMLQTNAGVRSL